MKQQVPNHPGLDERIDRLAANWGPVKKKLFGGYGYMVNGNLAFGTHKKDWLIVRAGEATANVLLEKPGIKIFDMTGHPMKNWFVASPEAYKTDAELLELLRTGYDFAKSCRQKEE